MPLIPLEGCDNCSLKQEWPFLKNPRMPLIPPDESTPHKIVMIGEAPGATEDIKGVPFVGETGTFLRDQIPGPWKKKLHWTNTVRCRPPGNRTPSMDEQACCSTYLEQDLVKLKPHAIFCIGSEALKYFWPEQNISKGRGIPFPIQFEDKSTAWGYSTFHPSWVLRQNRKDRDTGETLNTTFPVFRSDIQRFFKFVPTIFSTPPKIYTVPTDIKYPKSKQECLNLFNQLREPYAIDFETFKLRSYLRDAKLLTAACSDGVLTFAFPVDWPGDLNPWGKDIIEHIAKSKKRWIAQNSSMELSWMQHTTKQRNQLFEDTEVLARLYHNRTGLGSLEVLSRLYLGFNLKALSVLDKNRMNEYPLEKVLTYNAIDAWGTALIFDILGKLLCESRDNQVDNYVRTINTIESVVEMELQGLNVDITQSEQMQKVLFDQQQDFEKQALRIPEVKEYEKKESKVFSISSPPNVAAVLTRYCGIDLPKTEKQHYTTDEDALTPLLGKHPLINLILDYREVAKQLTTYIDPILSGKIIAPDKLIHPIYKACHVKTYRLSSEYPNIQNWPKRKNREIRRQIIPPKGHLFVAFDYAGLEVRVLAMASNDTNLRLSITDSESFLKSEDIHWYWLDKIIDYYPDYMKRLADMSGETEKKKILKAGRTIVKTDFVFSSFYGSLSKAVSHKTQIPLMIVQELHEEFWSMYSATRKWIDGQIQFYNENGFVQSLTGRIRNEVMPGWEITNCVDFETEALTQKGWLRYDEIEPGDVLLTMNPQTHLLEWQAATDIKKFPNYEGDVHYLNSRSFSAVTTPNHRWVIKDNNYWYERTSANMPTGWGSIPRILPYNCPARIKYSDNIIRLVGWVLTDGGFDTAKKNGYPGNQVHVYQVKKDNISTIDSLFSRLEVDEKIKCRTKLPKNRGEEVIWSFSGNWGRWLKATFPNRVLTSEFLLQLPINQLKILYETMMLGDGSKATKNTNASFSCRLKEGIDSFQMLAYLCGEVVHTSYEPPEKYKSKKLYKSMNNIPNSSGGWVSNTLRRRKMSISLGWVKHKIIYEKKGMWCPMIPNTFFVARREGKPFITGNTPIQGTGAELVLESQFALFKRALLEDLYLLPRINIHDDLTFIMPDTNEIERYILIAADEMTKPRFSFVTVPLKVECSVGPNWCDTVEVGKFQGGVWC